MQLNSIKGTLTELQCEKDFIENGIVVSQPIMPDSKYDFIVDINHKLYRIQCKSSTLSEDKTFISLKTKSTNIRTMKNSYYTRDDIDYFYTCHDGKSYLIPVEVAGRGETRLKFFSEQYKNPNIRWARDYEFGKILGQLKTEEVSC